MDWFTIRNIAEAVVAVGAATAASFAFVKYIWPPLLAFTRGTMAIADLPQIMEAARRFEAMDKALARIAKEVQPNGGSSMRDQINHTSNAVQHMHESLFLLTGEIRSQWDSDTSVARFIADGLGRHIWVSRTFLRWVNRSTDDVLGWGWLNSIAVEHRDDIRENWERAIAEEREFVAESYVKIDAYGNRFVCDMTASPVRDADGAVVRWVGIIHRQGWDPRSTSQQPALKETPRV